MDDLSGGLGQTNGSPAGEPDADADAHPEDAALSTSLARLCQPTAAGQLHRPLAAAPVHARVSGSEADPGFMGLCTRSCDSDVAM